MQLPPSATGAVATTTTTTDSYVNVKNYLPKQDPYLINRLVGFTEYSRALENLDALVQRATADELDVFDELVKEEPEFTVYTNLSRRLEQGRSQLVIRPEKAGDDFARQGIRWVTALARVELAAMLVGFSDHPQPFLAVGGTGYDLDQYRELLLDGAKMHFWSFTRDAQLPTLFKSFEPNAMTLAYVRRLNVANAFVVATIVVGGIRPESPQFAELSEYGGRLNAVRKQLQAQIEAYLAQQSQVKTGSFSSSSRALLDMCHNGICRKFSDAPDTAAAKK